jgi:threonine dehydratase
VRTYVDRVLTVDDVRIAQAARWLFTDAKLVVEPSGAASLAAVLCASDDSPLADRTRKVVAILSGGNVAADTIAALGH